MICICTFVYVYVYVCVPVRARKNNRVLEDYFKIPFKIEIAVLPL